MLASLTLLPREVAHKAVVHIIAAPARKVGEWSSISVLMFQGRATKST